MTYRELQYKLKNYRDAGYTLQVKLNSSALDLQLELDRIELDSQPEVVENSQPEVVENSQPEVVENSQPEVVENSQPEVVAPTVKVKTKRKSKEWFSLNVSDYRGKKALQKVLKKYEKNKATFAKVKKIASSLHKSFAEIIVTTLVDFNYFLNLCHTYAYQ